MFSNFSNNNEENKIGEYKNIFDKFDSNKDGFVNSLELANILKSIDINVSDEEIKQILLELDLEKNGEINYEELLELVEKRQKETDPAEKVINAFKLFDKEGNGLINISELKHIISNFGNNIQESEINDLLNEADIDMDGYINYEEFVRTMICK